MSPRRRRKSSKSASSSSGAGPGDPGQLDLGLFRGAGRPAALDDVLLAGARRAQTCVTALEKEPWDLGKITAVILRTSDVNDRLRNIGLWAVGNCHVCSRGSHELPDVDLDRLVRDTEKLATKIRRVQ